MSKLKLLYDVVRTMKAKGQVDGVLTAQVQKDREEILSLRNEFGKDATGEGKAKVSWEFHLDGGKVKRESLTEFSMPGGCNGRHGLLGKLFRHHRHHSECCGVKGVLSKISFALGILSSLKTEEKENGTAVISLDLSEVPEELRNMLREKANQRHACHGHCGILAEGDSIEMLEGVLLLTVGKGREIEKLTVNLNGQVHNPENEPHILAASADVQFAW